MELELNCDLLLSLVGGLLRRLSLSSDGHSCEPSMHPLGKVWHVYKYPFIAALEALRQPKSKSPERFPQVYFLRCSDNLASHFGTEILEIGAGFARVDF